MSNFSFLEQEWTKIYNSALEAEKTVYSSPRTTCFYARRALEQSVLWMYKYDDYLQKPYKDNLSSLIYEQTFKENLKPELFPKILIILKVGNIAVHEDRAIDQKTSLQIVQELFHYLYWFYRSYSSLEIRQTVYFQENLIPKPEIPKPEISQEKIKELEEKLEKQDREIEARDEEIAKSKAELEKLLKEIQERKAELKKIPDTHDYNESETRKFIIDILLEEAGWNTNAKDVKEYPVTGMPNEKGSGYADYVLWGDNGLPLAVVEAKRTSKDARIGREQAKLYADCLENMKGQRPLIFYTNGYQIFFWDDINYPPRSIQGFYKKDELETLIQRRNIKQNISKPQINAEIANRYYQIEAITRVCEALESKKRKSLVVMATGTGKTRTAIALVDILLKNNWVKRVLFLADRNALLKQSKNAFTKNLKYTSAEILKNPDETPSTRIILSTYPTMMNCLDETREGKKIFSAGHFDLIIIDEAHRSVYQKYRAIFEYFDSLLLGLTATPRDEVDKNTYSLFDMKDGIPTYYYEPEQAYKDKYLVPPKVISVPLKFHREGIKYSELSKQEREEYESHFMDEETGEMPEEIDSSVLYKWLFNIDTVDKVLKYLMENGLKVSGGDKLGKTIIFAKNHQHAVFIQERFDKNYPHYKGRFARVIDNYEPYAQNLLDNFSLKDNELSLVISVDMLDTGIDVPEILNLVFFKIVRSKAKFFQMIGRGTRLCENLFGPKDDKKEFLIFDFCENFEFFEENPEGFESKIQKPLSQKLFLKKLEIIKLLKEDNVSENNKVSSPVAEYITTPEQEIKYELIGELHNYVSGMNNQNFIVRTKSQLVEKYQDKVNWQSLKNNDFTELETQISGLPSEKSEEHESAKRFDLLIFNLEKALLEKNNIFNNLKSKVIDIISDLETKKTVPMVKEQMDLILEAQTEIYWNDITLTMLENLRKRLRELIIFLDKKEVQEIVFTDFSDTIGEGVEIQVNFASTGALSRYKDKVKEFINSHKNHIAIHKLMNNIPITKTDIQSLEEILYSAEEVESKEKFEEAYGKQEELGVFIRKLVGLDRNTAKNAFAEYLKENQYNSQQIKFIDQIINYLTHEGLLDPRKLYESPFTAISSTGLDCFNNDEVIDNIIEIVKTINKNAKAI